jgi:Superfamily I DNA and RNA helicases
MKMISDWKNDLIPPEQAHTTCETPEDVQFAHLYQLYERNLRAYNAVDFDDLIVMPTRLLQENAKFGISGRTVYAICWSTNIRIPILHSIFW